MTLRGIDVSKWQGGSLDWVAIDAAGYDFGFAKATEGLTIDPDYTVNAIGMDASTLIPGAYAWLTPGVDQALAAKTFCDMVGDFSGRLAGLDIEQSGCTVSMIRIWAAAFENRTSGHPLFIYIGRNVLSRLGNPNLSDLGPWWEPYYVTGGYPGDTSAVWTTGLGGWKGPTIWQYGPATIPGHSLPVDGDAFRGTVDELRVYGGNMNPLKITSEVPKIAALTVGDQLYNPDGSALVKTSVAQSQLSPFAAMIGTTAFRAITLTTGGANVLALVKTSTVTLSDPPADATPYSKADLDAARAAGYSAAKAKAASAVQAI